MGKRETISYDQAHDELESILDLAVIDDVAFKRGHFCMRMLGCPVSDKGEFLVNEAADGRQTREAWEDFEDQRDYLKERHENWREMQDE